MISKTQIADLIDKCEQKYEKCWQTLCYLKNYNKSESAITQLLDFQIDLTECLFDLTYMHDSIVKEKKATVNRKNSFKPDWFVSRLKRLAHYSEVIDATITMGRGLGDAFAWFLYRFEREQLLAHLKHPENFYMPTGVGGLGELEFVRQFRQVDQHFILYHGITNILRIGDVSFFDLKKLRLSGLGELKSKRTNDKPKHVTLSLLAFGPKDRIPSTLNSALVKEQIQEKPIEEEYFDKGRLNRQIKRMTESMNVLSKEKYNKKGEHINKVTYFDTLNFAVKKANRKEIICEKADSGLLITCVFNPRQKLSTRLFQNFKIPEGLDANTISQILSDNIKDNIISLGTVHYNVKKSTKAKINLMAGTMPLFWQNVELDSLKKIYFQKVEVITIYNPAFLMEKLRKHAFNFEVDRDGITVSKDSKLGKIGFGNFNLFIDWIRDYLHNEDSAIEMILALAKKGESKGKKGYKTIQALIQDYDFLGPRTHKK